MRGETGRPGICFQPIVFFDVSGGSRTDAAFGFSGRRWEVPSLYNVEVYKTDWHVLYIVTDVPVSVYIRMCMLDVDRYV